MSDAALYNQLNTTRVDIDQVIAAVINEADRMGVNAYEMRHMDGKFVLADLLLARAHALHGMATMRAVKTQVIINPPAGKSKRGKS